MRRPRRRLRHSRRHLQDKHSFSMLPPPVDSFRSKPVEAITEQMRLAEWQVARLAEWQAALNKALPEWQALLDEALNKPEVPE